MIQPPITSLYQPKLATIQKEQLGNIDLYYLNDESCNLCKIEWVFNAGTSHQSFSLQANFAADLLLEGTADHSSNDFARKLDELGAYFNVECGKDLTSFTLFVLSEHLATALNIIYPIFDSPLFSDEDYQNYLTESRQEFEQNLHNSGFIGRQNLRKKLYQNHPYGRLADLSSFDNISKEKARTFANQFFIGKSHTLFISGCANLTVLDLMRQQTNQREWQVAKKNGFNDSSQVTSTPGLIKIKHPTAQQDVVRIGINVPMPKEEDYLALNLCNTLLGGYFGSRLMQNIREEKGWTYGINSTILPGKQLTSLFISTDVLAGKGEATIAEINKEFSRLKTELTSDTELSQLCSYIKGNLLRSFDGVFEQMDRFQSRLLHELSDEHYLDYLALLNEVNPTLIQEVAKKYLNIEEFTKVIVEL